MRYLCSTFMAVAVTLTSMGLIHSQDNATVLAKLGEQTITDRDVDFQLGRAAIEDGPPLKELPPAVLQSVVYMIAQQRQALQTLRARKLAAGREEVEHWLEENGQPINGQNIPAAELIREQSRKAGITESNLRDHWAFRLSWQRFLQQQLTESNVAKHFENQSKRFNGTRFKVSIVDLAAPAGKSERRDKLAATLSTIRGRLMSGEVNWKDLKAELEKTDLLKKQAGSIRVREDFWARGTGDLEPTIVAVLMKLEPDAYSEPIHTPTGVHLVNLLEVEEGTKALSEVRDEVRAHMLLHLLDHLAKQSASQLPLKAVE